MCERLDLHLWPFCDLALRISSLTLIFAVGLTFFNIFFGLLPHPPPKGLCFMSLSSWVDWNSVWSEYCLIFPYIVRVPWCLLLYVLSRPQASLCDWVLVFSPLQHLGNRPKLLPIARIIAVLTFLSVTVPTPQSLPFCYFKYSDSGACIPSPLLHSGDPVSSLIWNVSA